MAAEAGETLPIWLQHIPHSWPTSPPLLIKARLSFTLIAIGVTWYSIRWITTRPHPRSWGTGIFGLMNLFLLGQMRYVNIPLFLLFEGQRRALEKVIADPTWLAMTCLWIQHVSFFALGNSNSLSSVDLSNAYNGISSYSIPLVGTLTFISNWAGPIWWALAAVQFLSEPVRYHKYRGKREKCDEYVEWVGLCTWFHGVAVCFLVAACIILRTHLFIWTVFSPKFLFQTVWISLTHVVIQGIVGGVIWRIG